MKTIESWGFKGKNWQLRHWIGSKINLEEVMKNELKNFQNLMDDDEVNAILICRGGYGTVRILDLLDFKKFRKHPKWIIGFSDITILHGHINQNLEIASLHASMPSVFKTNTNESLNSIKEALLGNCLKHPVPIHPFNSTGKVDAEIVGGNLSLLYSMNGTKHDIQSAGKILFIEDLDEYLYHIDRMMISLKNAGKLDHLAALVVGGMTDMNDNDTPFGKTAEEIIVEHVNEFDYPICFNFPAGHITNNKAIILGKVGKLEIGVDGVSWEQ
ncbi:MAG: LD-carboxypeptidase [Chitinophagales bacterium]